MDKNEKYTRNGIVMDYIVIIILSLLVIICSVLFVLKILAGESNTNGLKGIILFPMISMIIAYVGIPGRGKTLAAVNQAAALWLKNQVYGNLEYKIYANINLYYPDSINKSYKKITSYDDIEDMSNGVFLFDEMWTWVDSRISMSRRNRFWSRWSILTRKKNLDLLYTEQSELLIDSRIRKITEYLCRPRQEEVNKELTLINPYRREVHNYTVLKIEQLKSGNVLSEEFIIDNRLWFDKFDTMEVPDELAGGTYVSEAKKLHPKVVKDPIIDVYKTKGEQIGHIKTLYQVNEQVARLVWYAIYEGAEIKEVDVEIA